MVLILLEKPQLYQAPGAQKLSLGPLHHAQQQYLKLTAKILYGKEGRKIL
jgi:hypothetical protein